jgi:hypothetical protein
MYHGTTGHPLAVILQDGIVQRQLYHGASGPCSYLASEFKVALSYAHSSVAWAAFYEGLGLDGVVLVADVSVDRLAPDPDCVDLERESAIPNPEGWAETHWLARPPVKPSEIVEFFLIVYPARNLERFGPLQGMDADGPYQAALDRLPEGARVVDAAGVEHSYRELVGA